MRAEGAGAARPITCRYLPSPDGVHVEVWLPGGEDKEPASQVAYTSHKGIVAGDSDELRALLLWMASKHLRSVGKARHVYRWKDGAWLTELQIPCARVASARKNRRAVKRR
jgi:hypothetical protein